MLVAYLAKHRKGPAFHMDEAAAPTGPTGRIVIVQGSESAENWDPFSCSAGHQGRPFSAVPKPQGP
eukprot:6372045-Alexandrium_andersonii.AAC.1